MMATITERHTEVETPYGRLRGVIVDNVAAFLRVPYTEPPTGSKRFEMPAEAPRWTGIRDATKRGPIPPQLASRLDQIMGGYEAEQSEDCLHLDIWTTHKEGDRAPVLVFIHGGAFMTGGGSLPCYDGNVLAGENGLVVVNITYRLGILGFWPTREFGRLNLALHDQLAALRWIKQAISCFGGNPDCITVAGQSAGAFSIAAQLCLNESRKLFKRALMMSAPVGLRMRSSQEARPVAEVVYQVLGLETQDAEKLRAMPVAQIFEGLKQIRNNPLAGPGDVTPLFMPNLDEEFLADQPSEILLSGSGHWCDVMIGTTREEYAAFSYTNPSLDELSDAQLKDLFRAQLGDDADIALARYRSKRVPATPKTLLGDLNTDGFFTTKSLEIAAAQSRGNGRSFSYFFDWQSTNPSMGACHCIDLPFLFGNIDLWMKAAPMLKGSDRQEVSELSRIYRGAVTAFATRGDPNGPGLPEWPAYGRSGTALHFDRRIRALSHFG